MKTKPTRKQLILLLGLIIIIGALVGRKYALAGSIISLTAIGIWLLNGFLPALATVVNFKKAGQTEKAALIAYLVFIYIFLRGAISHTIPYFLLLLTFAMEYILDDKKK